MTLRTAQQAVELAEEVYKRIQAYQASVPARHGGAHPSMGLGRDAAQYNLLEARRQLALVELLAAIP